ncbi:NfeD family protein [Roseivivax sp. CAU 1753]
MADLLIPTSWVFWFAAGVALLIIEVLLPTFLALGFGIGAWIVSAMLFFLPSELFTLPVVLLIWAVLSAVIWIALRLVFRNRHSGNKAPEGDINEY